MKKLLFISLILLIIVILIALIAKTTRTARISLGNKIIMAEIADNDMKRTRGLSNRKSLDNNRGMLFNFPKSDVYRFWMKNTLIPLDIIWIENNQIVDMISLQPQSGFSIPDYTPKSPATFVLEVNAGFIKENDIKIGDKIKIEI